MLVTSNIKKQNSTASFLDFWKRFSRKTGLFECKRNDVTSSQWMDIEKPLSWYTVKTTYKNLEFSTPG